MLKIILNTIWLLALMIGNMALINWYVNQLDLDKVPVERTFINNVQASAVPTTKDFSYLIKQDNRLTSSNTSPASKGGADEQEVTLKFKETSIYLERTEQKQFEEKLKTLNLNHASEVEVLVGPSPSGENVLTLQATRLRAQAVARLVYPYTQKVKMRYLPSLEAGLVVVKFSQLTDLQK